MSEPRECDFDSMCPHYNYLVCEIAILKAQLARAIQQSETLVHFTRLERGPREEIKSALHAELEAIREEMSR